jgi:hypothetical protein
LFIVQAAPVPDALQWPPGLAGLQHFVVLEA